MPDAVPTDTKASELLDAAGLSPSDDELAIFEMMYPLLRAKADTVYTVEQGYEA